MDQRRKAIQETEQRISRLEGERDTLYRKLGELSWRSGALAQLSAELHGGLESLERAESARAALSAEYDRREADLLALEDEANKKADERRATEQREREASRTLGMVVLEHSSRFDLPALEPDITALRELVSRLRDRESSLEGEATPAAKSGFFSNLARNIGRTGKQVLVKAGLPALRKRVEEQAVLLGRAASLVDGATWQAVPACATSLAARDRVREELEAIDRRQKEIAREKADTLAWLAERAGQTSWQAARRALETARRTDAAAREALYLEAGALHAGAKGAGGGKSGKKGSASPDADTPEAERAREITKALGDCMRSMAEARDGISRLEAELRRDALLEEQGEVQAQIADHEERIAMSKTAIASNRQRLAEITEEIEALGAVGGGAGDTAK